MKRVITAFCLAMLGTFALTACGQRSDPPTNRESTPAEAQDAIDAAQPEEDEDDVKQGGGPHVD